MLAKVKKLTTTPKDIYEMPWYKNAKIQKRLFLALALIPSFGGYLLFVLYPNILSVYYSFLNWDGMSEPIFVGLHNYKILFTDQFVWRAMRHNMIVMLVVPPLTVFISLVLAYLITNKNYRENKFHEVIFFIPNVLSSVVVALLWRFIYDGDYGLLNGFLRLFGLKAETYWLGDEKTALAAVMVPMIWAAVGFYIIIYMNAMKSIPPSLYESATLDGASSMTILFKITIPLIWGVVRVTLLLMMIGSLKGFETILILTNGGPAGSTDLIGLYMYNTAFGKVTNSQFHQYGYASAIGMFLFVILIISKALMDKYLPNDEVQF